MSTAKPLISVLMTAYNREKYIADAIESVLASTYSNFELIITDDQSKDRTVEIAKSYSEKDKRVKVFVNEQNLGDYPNRNKAASYAQGKYLKYVDADDFIYPWGIQLLVDMMNQFPEAGWGLCSLIQYVKKPFPFQLGPKEAYNYHYNGPGLFFKAPLSSIFRSDAFHAVGGFSEIRMAGDFDMWHKMAQKYPVVLMPDGIVWYREHGEQEVNSYSQYILTYESIMRKYLFDSNCPLSKEEVKKIFKKYKKKLIKNMAFNFIKLNSAGLFNEYKKWQYHFLKGKE
jgi:glycosyltransferase involved in cell wall biosynthesis